MSPGLDPRDLPNTLGCEDTVQGCRSMGDWFAEDLWNGALARYNAAKTFITNCMNGAGNIRGDRVASDTGRGMATGAVKGGARGAIMSSETGPGALAGAATGATSGALTGGAAGALKSVVRQACGF